MADASTISTPNRETRWLSHTGSEVNTPNATNVSRSQNSSAGYKEILTWTVPEKYTELRYAAGRHITKAELRSMETITGSTGDDTVVDLTTNIRPITGEPEIADQPYPVVVAYNTTTGTQYDIADVDYGANQVTLASDPSDGDEVKLYPAFSEGRLQYRGIDSFGHTVGPLDQWGTPVHVFNDFNQLKNQTRVHMIGSGQFEKSETFALYLDSDQTVVWEDADYPNGNYVSQFEQRVDIMV